MRPPLQITPIDRTQLESFRRAAGQVRSASIIVKKKDIRVKVVPGKPGWVDVYLGLLADEPFRSLAMAIRLVYQQTEDSHFFKICNIAYRLGDEGARSTIAALRIRYKNALEDGTGEVPITGPSGTEVFAGKDVFEHWLYGVAFHQDAERQEAVRRLASDSVRFHWSVQATSLSLAHCILDLDTVVRTLLARAVEAGV